MFRIIAIDMYALLDTGATLSCVSDLIAKFFYTLPDVFHEPFVVSTPVGESIVAKRVYRNFPITFPNRVSQVDLVELDCLILMSFWV